MMLTVRDLFDVCSNIFQTMFEMIAKAQDAHRPLLVMNERNGPINNQ